MKFAKLLFLMVFSVFLLSSVSAVVVYGNWEDDTQSITIDDGDQVNFVASYFTMNPPMYINITLFDAEFGIHVKTFEENLEVEDDWFENLYLLDKSDYFGAGRFELVMEGSDGSSSETFTLYLEVKEVEEENSEPVITSSPVLTVDENSNYNYQIEANDSDGDSLTYSLIESPSWLSISSSGLVSGSAPEVSSDKNFEVKLKVSDSKSSVFQNYTLTVKNLGDVTSPVITLNGNEEVDVEVFSNYTDKGATATDNVDGNLTNSIVVSGKVNTSVVGTYEIKYSVSDSAGNLAEKIRKVNVVDTQAPNLTIIGGNEKIYVGAEYNDKGAVAYDNYEGNLTDSIYAKIMVDTKFTGKQEVRYIVKDSSGNTAIKSRIVEVIKRPSGGGTILLPEEEDEDEDEENIPDFIPKYNQTVNYSSGSFYLDYSPEEMSCCKKIWFAILDFVRRLFGL